MKKIAILHFSPIEKYPPITNLLDFLEQQAPQNREYRVFTTAMPGTRGSSWQSRGARIRIERIGSIANGAGNFARYLTYLRFNLLALWRLLTWRPDLVLYYETLSAWPALWFKKTTGRSKPLFVHYHEYISPTEYQEGMVLNRFFHRMEQKMYPAFDWISHTNTDRMQLFRRDNPNIPDQRCFLLPNYPSAAWKNGPLPQRSGSKRFVYVGALSMGNMYTAEFAAWVSHQQGRVSWDIYSSNNTAEAEAFIASLETDHVRFKGAVPYEDLPVVLREYDTGVVLYKGTIPNYVYNIPNKLYEYFACGLDVWFPTEMTSCLSMVTQNVYPVIKAVDFQRLDQLGSSDLDERKDLMYSPSTCYYETILPLILEQFEKSMQSHNC